MLNEFLVQYQGIENIEPMNTLLSRHIASWIEMNRPNISITVYNQYVNILNLHIVPYFDPRKITVSSVTAGDMEDCYTFTQCFPPTIAASFSGSSIAHVCAYMSP